MQRKAYLDYAKGIGILLVILGHVIELTPHINSWNTIRELIYAFHMPLFFFISGMIMAMKVGLGLQPNFKSQEIRKSVVRLFLPYITWSVLYMLPIAAVSIFHGHGFPLERLYAFLTFRGLPPLWFLAALFFAEFIFWLCIDRLQSRGRRWLLLAILAVGSCVLSLWFNSCKDAMGTLYKYPLIFLCRQVMTCFFFLAGYEFAGWYRNLTRNQKCVLLIFSAITFFSVQLMSGNIVNMHTFDFDSPALFLLTGLAGTIGLLTFCDMLRSDLKVLTALGRKSFDLMMLHYPPVPTIKMCSYIWGGQTAITFAAAVIVACVGSECLEYVRRKAAAHGVNLYI